MDQTSYRNKAVLAGRRMKANFLQVCRLVSGRKSRATSGHVALRPGRRPQDLVAIALFTIGLAMVLLDNPSSPWRHALPKGYWSIFSAFTDIGKSHWILWSSGLVCLGLLLTDARQFSFRLRMLTGAAWTYLGFLFYTVAASGLLAIALKWCFGRARPKLYGEVGPVAFSPFIFDGSYTSFPSGHSTTVGALAAALAIIFPTWRWLIAVVAFWAAFSRIMVGAHYPSDVVAGTLLGVVFTYFSARFLARRRIGFHIDRNGSIVPNMGAISARACFRALVSVLSGRRTAGRRDENAVAEDQAVSAKNES